MREEQKAVPIYPKSQEQIINERRKKRKERYDEVKEVVRKLFK
jgi:predicted nucleic acid-binding OB-fold protein